MKSLMFAARLGVVVLAATSPLMVACGQASTRRDTSHWDPALVAEQKRRIGWRIGPSIPSQNCHPLPRIQLHDTRS
jgi:hypothetical protein